MVDIQIYDDIGPEWLGMVSAKGILAQIKDAKDQPINVKINSGGGSVDEAAAIYNALTAHAPGVEISIDGIAASAASYIAMAGKRIKIAENARVMIHRAWTFQGGNALAFQKTIEVLNGYDETLADVYAARTGKPKEEILDKLTAETWFSAKEAVEYGLADEIGQKLNVKAGIAPGRFAKTPEDLIDHDKPKQYAAKREAARAKLCLTKYPR